MTIAINPDSCSVCCGKTTHWTAEIEPNALYMLTWCDVCWIGCHPYEVTRDEWLAHQITLLKNNKIISRRLK